MLIPVTGARTHNLSFLKIFLELKPSMSFLISRFFCPLGTKSYIVPTESKKILKLS